MKAPKVIFVCRECGCTVSNWVGKCPDCGLWNTMEEEQPPQEKTRTGATSLSRREAEVARLSEIEEFPENYEDRNIFTIPHSDGKLKLCGVG